MKDSIYFNHDYNAQSDPKVVRLRLKYWREWYWLFRATVEMMREDADVVVRTSEIDANAYRLHYDSKEYSEFLDYLVEIWLLYLDTKDWAYFSKRLQEDVEHMRSKSKKARASANARRKGRDANALQTECESNAIEESIGEERRGEENSITVPDSKSETDLKSFISKRNTVKKIKWGRWFIYCRWSTPDIRKEWNKAKKSYGIDWIAAAVNAYIKEIKWRPDDSYADHRFSLYEFFKQGNWLRRFYHLAE